MRKTALFVILGLCLAAASVRAEPVPEAALEKDFNACMGGENPDQDPQRRDYCLCIHDSMKDWSLDEYGQVAMEGAKAHNAGQEPPQLQAIAKACISKVLHD